ncbi:MAG: polysaccharide deacetylase family protein [Bacteroidia bacterium]
MTVKKFSPLLRFSTASGWSSQKLLLNLGLGGRMLQNRSGGRIIAYTGVYQEMYEQEGKEVPYYPSFVSVETLETQLSFFKENFAIVSLQDYYKGMFDENRLTVSLTFDCGYLNQLKYVLPLLEKYEIPATFFLTALPASEYLYLWTDFMYLAKRWVHKSITIGGEVFKKKDNAFISQQSRANLEETMLTSDFKYKVLIINAFKRNLEFQPLYYPADYHQLMDNEEIRTLAASPWVTIGSMGYHYNDLSVLAPQKALEELKQSKAWIEGIIGKEINIFAFPFGAHSPALLKAAQSAGYSQLLTHEFLNEEDRLIPALRQRLPIHPQLSWKEQLVSLYKGEY